VLLVLCTSVITGVAAVSPAGHGDRAWESESGEYRLHYRSLEPLAINRMLAWALHLETSAGEPVEGAEIRVSGGMPAHDHGLPTAPRITRELGGGDYLLEGLRFHMNGEWRITVDVQVSGEHDTVVIALQL
jgi:hypothetical protein